MIPLYIPTNNGYNHGFKVVQDSIHSRWPFGKIEGPGKWNNTHLNQTNQANPKRKLIYCHRGSKKELRMIETT